MGHCHQEKLISVYVLTGPKETKLDPFTIAVLMRWSSLSKAPWPKNLHILWNEIRALYFLVVRLIHIILVPKGARWLHCNLRKRPTNKSPKQNNMGTTNLIDSQKEDSHAKNTGTKTRRGWGT